MKKIVCEMCGSNDFIKKEGFFCCENCGTKYTVEEAKKMMIEGPVEIKGKISIDTSQADYSLLEVVKTAMNAKNYNEVYEMSSKLVTSNAAIWEGWLYRGIGAAHISTLQNNKVSEAVACFDKAYSMCDEEKKKEVKADVIKYTLEMSDTSLTNICDSFETNPSEDSAAKFIDALRGCFEGARSLQKKYDYSYSNVHDIEDMYVMKVFGMLNSTKDDVDRRFGREAVDRTDDRYDRFIDETDGIIAIMKTIFNNYPIRSENVETYLRFFQKCIRSTTHACSYVYYAPRDKYVESKSFDRNEVRARNQLWEETYARKEEFIKRANEREKYYHKVRNDEYWAGHGEEREKLTNEITDINLLKQQLTDEMKDIENAINIAKKYGTNPLQEEVDLAGWTEKINATKQKINSKKLFDFEGKKPLKAELEQYKKQYDMALNKAKAARKAMDDLTSSKLSTLFGEKNKVMSKVNSLNEKLKHINNELTKKQINSIYF